MIGRTSRARLGVARAKIPSRSAAKAISTRGRDFIMDATLEILEGLEGASLEGRPYRQVEEGEPRAELPFPSRTLA
ncbi:hypothetical protein GCM10022280_08940 [Sphingomonas swuensis]|uniref:Uncharacterized protein n=1 Tax=Sphingomonas swuensis TaxID=977800 RepID=A0ABP7SKY2_9SPHN